MICQQDNGVIKKALVTGGGGFVGFAITRRLLELGIEPVVLGRSHYPHIEKLGVRQYLGDICNADDVQQAVQGCDTIFHVAAKAGIWGAKKTYWDINFHGTENIIQACLENNIKRLVYTSTPSVVFAGKSIKGAGETIPYANKFLCHYAASKTAAEKCVLRANSNLATVALRPHLVWGPGDTNLIPRLVARGKKGQLKQVGDGSNLVDIAYIDNVVDAHILAAENLAQSGTAAGKAYFISQGEPVNLWGWINDLLARVDIAPVQRKISLRKAYFAGTLLEICYFLAGIKTEPLMTRFLAHQLAGSHWFSIQSAKDDFGYIPRISTETGMKRMVQWLKKGTAL